MGKLFKGTWKFLIPARLSRMKRTMIRVTFLSRFSRIPANVIVTLFCIFHCFVGRHECFNRFKSFVSVPSAEKYLQDYMTRTWEEWTRMQAEYDPKIIFLFVSYCSLHSRQWKGSIKGFSFSVQLQLKLCLQKCLYKLLGEKAGMSIVLFWILKTCR